MSSGRIVLEVLSDVLDDGAYLNLSLKKRLNDADGLDERTRRTVSAQVHYTLEKLNYIDYLIAHYAHGRINRHIKNILRLGFARALFMDTPGHAVCSESVKLAQEIGKGALKGYVNGVMRSLCRDIEAESLPELPADSVQRCVIEFGFPDFLVREYINRFGEERARSIMGAKETGTSVRPQYPYTADELESELKHNGADFRRGRYVEDCFHILGGFDPVRSKLFTDGRITIQSESSALVSKATGVKPGMRVLDACAAPGGKTANMAGMMEYKGEITAWDTHEHRVKLIEQTMKRLHVTSVKTQTRNASIPAPEYNELFDVVLADVPCSGLGVMSKPDIRLRVTDNMIEELSKVQKSILDTVSLYVKPGGALVYSTCTLSSRENENVVNEFLKKGTFEPGEFTGFPESLKKRVSGGMLTLLPDEDETEGFFIARLIRKG